MLLRSLSSWWVESTCWKWWRWARLIGLTELNIHAWIHSHVKTCCWVFYPCYCFVHSHQQQLPNVSAICSSVPLMRAAAWWPKRLDYNQLLLVWVKKTITIHSQTTICKSLLCEMAILVFKNCFQTHTSLCVPHTHFCVGEQCGEIVHGCKGSFLSWRKGKKYHGFCYHCSVTIPVVLQTVWVLSSTCTLGIACWTGMVTILHYWLHWVLWLSWATNYLIPRVCLLC